MLRSLALASVTCVALAQLTDVELSNIDVVQPPSFNLHSMSFSMFMNCNDQLGNCFTGTVNTPGVFNRQVFFANLQASYDLISKAVRAEDGTTDPSLAFQLQESNFVVERTIVQTSPFSPDNIVGDLTDAAPVTDDPSYWNVFIRVSLVDVPVDVSDRFRSVIYNFVQSYTFATIHYDSLWISTEADFITSGLEPVQGRGHKSQKLLIPLIMGVFAMLVVPIIISACLVMSAKNNNAAALLLAEKEKQIREVNDNIVQNQGALDTYRETEEARDEEMAKLEEKKKHRNAYEIQPKDVDWTPDNRHAPVTAPPPAPVERHVVSEPFGGTVTSHGGSVVVPAARGSEPFGATINQPIDEPAEQVEIPAEEPVEEPVEEPEEQEEPVEQAAEEPVEQAIEEPAAELDEERAPQTEFVDPAAPPPPQQFAEADE
ncbi:hypothetical protein DIPPA_16504 [Diplonema papillatum]|nr:hypothetical protein DIPPA_16504 [Diplonema papillatum]